MAKKFKLAAVLSCIVTVVLAVGYALCAFDVLLTLAITFGTVAYHLTMRLLVGFVFNAVMHNKADYRRQFFQVGTREMSLYKKLKVKQWSRKMPTYDSSFFDPRLHTWDEIAQAMCQSELVHETIVLLSFLPICAGAWFGAYPVFIITSVLSAAFDASFVVMQRHNRARIVTFLARSQGKAQG